MSDESELEFDDFSFEDDDDIVDVDDVASTTRHFADELVAKLAYDAIYYKPWLAREYVDKMMLSRLGQLSVGHLNLLETESLVLLEAKRWQPDEVVISCLDDKPRLYDQCGLPLPYSDDYYKLQAQDDYTCWICCEDYPRTFTFSMKCGHEYCILCYATYLANELHHGTLVRCMDSDCTLTIPHRVGEKILSVHDESRNGGVKLVDTPLNENRLLLAHAKVAVAKNTKRFVACPLVDCNNFVEIVEGEVLPDKSDPAVTTVPVVKCVDGHEFCFRCHYENHLPCPCWITQKWIKKCADDLETANWIEANTHNCPGCDGPIEKNGGCNHMVCLTCRKEFCWICHGDWLTHKNNYNCNKFREGEPQQDENRKRKRELLNRYLHYYKRFQIHELLMLGDRKTVAQVEKIARLYMEDMAEQTPNGHLSWNDIQFLTDAIILLTKGRKTLKWTYVFAFYLGETNFGHIFEDNQNYLTTLVEELLKIFEEIVDKKNKVVEKKNTTRLEMILKYKSQIINLLSIIQLRLRNLIDYANENLANGLLKFDT